MSLSAYYNATAARRCPAARATLEQIDMTTIPTSLYAMDAWVRGFNSYYTDDTQPEQPPEGAMIMDKAFYAGWKTALLCEFGDYHADRAKMDTPKLAAFMLCKSNVPTEANSVDSRAG
jgi:hypothetical protein